MPEKMTPVQHDTSIHVAQFLQEGIGSTRQARIALDQLPLDGDLLARQIKAEVKLTRIPTGILVNGRATAIVTLQCGRCLEDFAQDATVEFADEYRPSIDILTGALIAPEGVEGDEDDIFAISDLHLLDVAESLRQAFVLGLPMAPLCREDCPGLPELSELSDEGDARLAVLAQLLQETGAETNETTANGRRARRR
jgi:uncharacterized protein